MAAVDETEAIELTDLAIRIVQSAGDDKPAEAELCRAFAPRIRMYGLRRLADPHRVSDFTQEVLIIVLEALRGGRVEKPASIAAFMLSTCRVVALDWRRNRARRDDLFARYVRELIPCVEAPSVAADQQRLGQCLDGLPPREFQVIYEYFMRDKAVDEIAAALQTSAGNVRVLRHRAIVRLRQCMSAAENES